MSDIRLKKISVENSPLVIQNGIINITNTDSSDSILTGTLVSNGGISINCTYESTSSTSGGALTVGGGISSMKDIYIGKSLILDSLNSTIQVNGVSENRLFLDNITNKQFYISLDGIDRSFELTEEGIYINNNTPSENFTTGALRVLGGITINSTEESSSITCGSGLTVFGGSSIVKKLYVGGGIETINSSNTIGNLYTTTSGNVGIGTTSPDVRLHISGDIKFTNATGSGLNLSNTISTNITSTNLNITGITAGSLNITGITSQNINTDNLDVTNITSENIILTDITSSNALITNINSTNITANKLIIDTGITSGSSLFTSIIVTNGSLNATFNSNTLGSLFTINENVGINTTSPNGQLSILSETIPLYVHQTKTDNNMPIAMFVGNGGNNNTYYIDTGSYYNGTCGNVRIGFTDDGQYSSSIQFYTKEIGSENTILNEHFRITSSGDIGIGTTSPNHKLDIDGNVNVLGNVTLGSFYIVSNKIGINNTSPVNNVDINTNTRITDILTIEKNIVSENFTTGALVIKNGGLSIDCTEDATSYTAGGGISVAGGVSIDKRLNVNGNVRVNGILKIENNTDSTTTSNGSVQVLGGMSIIKNLNIGQITSTDKLIISSKEASLNSISGSLICNGGITISSTEQSTSSTSGGALSIFGGMGIKKDMYIEGNEFKKGISNYYSETNNFIQIYKSNNEKIYSLDRDYFTNNFSLSRYNDGSFVEKTFEISSVNGILTFNNTKNSTSKSDASIIISGGVSINSTENSLNSTVGGALTVYGGQSIVKNLNIGGTLILESTIQSVDVSSGAMLISGGVGILKNLNVNGNTTINGNLYVNGTTTSLDSTNTILEDNLLVLNSAPSGLKDSGFIITRYQEDNDGGFGDIVNESVYINFQIPNQSGMINSEIKLPNSASSLNDYYKNWWIKITSGFSNNQVRKITGYDGSTKIATVSSSWTTQNPGENDIIFLYNRNYVGLIYNETDDLFVFGSTLDDPGNTSVSLTDNIKVKMGDLVVSNTTNSTNSSSGTIVVFGGISINCTQDASNNTVGGSLTINGGTSIKKKLYVGDELYVNNINFTPNVGDKWKSTSFSANNNQIAQETITGLELDSNIWGFDIFLTARLNADTDLYTNYHLRGINKTDSWEIVKTYVGDDMGIEFYITNDGEIQYTSPYFDNFISLIFKWRMFVN